VTGLTWSALLLAGGLLSAAIGELVSEEIRGWLDLAPEGILRLAARRLDPSRRREIYEEEWQPELGWALRGAEARPITRLILGMHFALSLLIAAPKIDRAAASRAVAPAAPKNLAGLFDGISEQPKRPQYVSLVAPDGWSYDYPIPPHGSVDEAIQLTRYVLAVYFESTEQSRSAMRCHPGLSSLGTPTPARSTARV
jgi:hypothetical protein